MLQFYANFLEVLATFLFYVS